MLIMSFIRFNFFGLLDVRYLLDSFALYNTHNHLNHTTFLCYFGICGTRGTAGISAPSIHRPRGREITEELHKKAKLAGGSTLHQPSILSCSEACLESQRVLTRCSERCRRFRRASDRLRWDIECPRSVVCARTEGYGMILPRHVQNAGMISIWALIGGHRSLDLCGVLHQAR